MAQDTRLIHANADKKSDEELAGEARAHLAQHPELQATAEFIQVIRKVDLPELNAERRRALLPASKRLHAYGERSDLRAAVTTAITRVPLEATREMAHDYQASLIDKVVNACKTVELFDKEFIPDDLATYIDGADLLHSHWDQFRWDVDDDPHRVVVASFIESLLVDREPYTLDGKTVELQPILKPWDILDVIDADVLLDGLPREIQKQLFKAWHVCEAQHVDEAWHAMDYIGIATPRVLVMHIKLADLKGVVTLGLKRMGFAIEEKVTEVIQADAERPPEKDGADIDGGEESARPKA